MIVRNLLSVVVGILVSLAVYYLLLYTIMTEQFWVVLFLATLLGSIVTTLISVRADYAHAIIGGIVFLLILLYQKQLILKLPHMSLIITVVILVLLTAQCSIVGCLIGKYLKRRFGINAQ
jgi:hypothetical protein